MKNDDFENITRICDRKYFCRNQEQQGTGYLEYTKGTWDKETFWQDDSMYLNMDFESFDYVQTLQAILPNYDTYGVTEILPGQWEQIKSEAKTRGGTVAEMVEEIDCWMQKTFQTHRRVTILGI